MSAAERYLWFWMNWAVRKKIYGEMKEKIKNEIRVFFSKEIRVSNSH
jgi:hypothetical protein